MTNTSLLRTPRDIAKFIAERAHLETMQVNCLCSDQDKDEVHFYLLADKKTAPHIARALGGFVFGTKMVGGTVLVSPEFHCQGRADGWTSHSCHCCATTAAKWEAEPAING